MRTRTHRLALTVVALTVPCAALAGCGDEVAATTTPSGSTATGTTTGTTTESPTGTPTGTPTAPATPSASPTPDVPVPASAVTEVPADFPLADAFPDTNGDDGSPVRVTDRPGLSELTLCGTTVWTEADTLDVAGTTYTGEAEDSRARTLAVYTDEVAAQEALDHLRDTIAACPDGSIGGTDQVYAEAASSQGSVTFTHRYRFEGNFDTGLEVIEAVAIGNALYLASYYGEGGGSAGTIASSVEYAAESSSGVLDAMAVFAAR